jgi:hypothetical protein
VSVVDELAQFPIMSGGVIYEEGYNGGMTSGIRKGTGKLEGRKRERERGEFKKDKKKFYHRSELELYASSKMAHDSKCEKDKSVQR